MRHHDDDESSQQFTLLRTGNSDVRFTGWKLAEVDNYNPDAVDKATGKATGSARWRELAVYETKSGKFVCHRLGRSQVQGETDRGSVLVVDPDHPEKALDPDSFKDVDMTVDETVSSFFGQDGLAKALYAKLRIEDVEIID